jgi:hypothetical protein
MPAPRHAAFSATRGNHPGGAHRTRVFSRKPGSGSGIHSRGCLLIAGGDERRVQPGGAFRVALRYQRGDRSEFADNEELRVFSDVAAWSESLLINAPTRHFTLPALRPQGTAPQLRTTHRATGKMAADQDPHKSPHHTCPTSPASTARRQHVHAF